MMNVAIMVAAGITRRDLARGSPLATVHVQPSSAILDLPPAATCRLLPPSTPIDRPRSIPFFRAPSPVQRDDPPDLA